MKKKGLRPLLNHLDNLRTQFNRDSAIEKLTTLKLISVLPLEQKKDILFYHDHLLFLLAYPDNKAIRSIAIEELERIARTNEKLHKKNQTKFYNQFHATGITHSSVTWRPSVDACHWMVNHFPDEIEIIWSDDTTSKLDELLPMIVLPAQVDSLQAEDYDTLKFLREVSNSKSDHHSKVLGWICNRFLELNVPELVRDYLFDSLELTVDWKISDFKASRTGNLLNKKDIAFQELPLIKKFDVKEQIKKPLLNFKELKNKEFNEVSFSSKSVLAALSRETDTVSYANRIFKASIENGLDMMLFEMRPGRKMPIENYLGFVIYKNGVPVGYGGCWIFLDRCEIGINIFESFRGGENSLILINLMRVYHQLFHVKRFVVPPYQFGEDNPEGIQSGAFWFYYRLGYRPVDKQLKIKADSEFAKIQKNPNYRSSYKILESFTLSPMEFLLDGFNPTEDLKLISKKVNSIIGKKYNGDSTNAVNSIKRQLINDLNISDYNRWTQLQRKGLDELCLLFSEVDYKNLDEKSLQKLITLLKLKHTHEIEYSKIFQELGGLKQKK